MDIYKKLQYKIFPLFVLIFSTFILGSLFINIRAIKDHNIEITTIGARNIYKTIVLMREWNAIQGGVYAYESKTTPINEYLDPSIRELNINSKKLALINPAYMTRQIAELAEKNENMPVKIHITSLNLIRPENKPDQWEENALNQFENGSREVIGIEQENDKKYFRYMGALITKKACLKCHEKQGYEEGGVRGGISVTLNMDSIEKSMEKDIWIATITHLISYILLVSISGLSIKIIINRLKKLEELTNLLQRTKENLTKTCEYYNIENIINNSNTASELYETSKANNEFKEEFENLNTDYQEMLNKLKESSDVFQEYKMKL